MGRVAADFDPDDGRPERRGKDRTQRGCRAMGRHGKPSGSALSATLIRIWAAARLFGPTGIISRGILDERELIWRGWNPSRVSHSWARDKVSRWANVCVKYMGASFAA
jgi:hypothetical protein